MSILSVVLPAYNEEQMVGKTCRVLHEVLSGAGISYELVLVNDGSKDNTWNEILKAGEKDPNILGVHFSRNFGKEAAVFAGLAQASGDAVAVMDCDLQHPAETLIEMYQKWKEGYEVIEGVKKSRGEEGFLHKESAGFFYGIMSKATKVDMQNASDFKMMDRKVVNSILSLTERNMFFRATFVTTHGWQKIFVKIRKLFRISAQKSRFTSFAPPNGLYRDARGAQSSRHSTTAPR